MPLPKNHVRLIAPEEPRARRSDTDRRCPEYLELVSALTERDVQYLMSPEQLRGEQAMLLARFEAYGKLRKKWTFLKACDGGPCPHQTCNAACWFGERLLTNRLIRQAADLFSETGLPIFMVTLVDPHDRRLPQELKTLTVDAMAQSLRRRLRNAPAHWKDAKIVAVIETSYERDLKGKEYWGPHTHLILALETTREEIKKVLTPRPKRGTYIGHQHVRRIEIEAVTTLDNALGYSTKRGVKTRQIRGGGLDPVPFELSAFRQREFDRWLLLHQRPGERIILRGLKRAHGNLTLLKR